MNVRKFYAGTTREALRQVRDALGADAIILSNRQVGAGIEIMAVANMDVASLAGFAAAPAIGHPRPQPASQSVPQSAPDPTPDLFQEKSPLPAQTVVPPAQSSQTGSRPAPVAAPDGVVQDIVQEIKSLRGMLEGQLAGLAWGEMQRNQPVRAEIMRSMLAAGFSPLLARQLLERLPADCDVAKGMKWVKAALTHNLHAVPAGADLVERGGIYALVGPTGVGKTTTVAKLAARCRLKHGPDKLALLTTDSYRIGAHEQLRIYGKILGVPVYAIKDEADLQLTLSDLQSRHLILIDTVGMSQRDRRLAEQVALLCGDGRNVKRLLLISANAQGSTLDDVVRAYKGAGMDGCILTKIDEAIGIGGALDVIIRHKLSLHYITNGQRVPEDLHLANALYLVDRAFKAVPDALSSFSLQEGDLPLAMGAMSGGDAGAYSLAAGGVEAGGYGG